MLINTVIASQKGLVDSQIFLSCKKLRMQISLVAVQIILYAQHTDLSVDRQRYL